MKQERTKRFTLELGILLENELDSIGDNPAISKSEILREAGELFFQLLELCGDNGELFIGKSRDDLTRFVLPTLRRLNHLRRRIEQKNKE